MWFTIWRIYWTCELKDCSFKMKKKKILVMHNPREQLFWHIDTSPHHNFHELKLCSSQLYWINSLDHFFFPGKIIIHGLIYRPHLTSPKPEGHKEPYNSRKPNVMFLSYLEKKNHLDGYCGASRNYLGSLFIVGFLWLIHRIMTVMDDDQHD